MIDVSKFKSPSIFCLAVGLTVAAWYYTQYFILIDKFIPLDFAVEEELIINKAELKSLLITSPEGDHLVARAKVEVAKYKQEELQKLMDSTFFMHGQSLRWSMLFIILSVPAFFLELAWQRKAFNETLKFDYEETGAP